MKQLSPYEVMHAEVNRIAQAVTDPSTADFGSFFLGATAVLESYGDQNQAMNSTLCAYAINALDEDARAAFTDSVELTGPSLPANRKPRSVAVRSIENFR